MPCGERHALSGNTHSCNRMPPTPSGFSMLCFGPVTNPSSDMEIFRRSRDISVLFIDRIAHEVAVRRELVVEPARAVIIQPGMPIEAGPALPLHLVAQPRNQALADAGGALRRIDVEIAEVARRREAQRVLVHDIVCDANDAALRVLGDDGMDRRCVVQDARPGVARQRLIGLALVEGTVTVEQLTPALLVLGSGLANAHIAHGVGGFIENSLTSGVDASHTSTRFVWRSVSCRPSARHTSPAISGDSPSPGCVRPPSRYKPAGISTSSSSARRILSACFALTPSLSVALSCETTEATAASSGNWRFRRRRRGGT